jgi:hypothetical protein
VTENPYAFTSSAYKLLKKEGGDVYWFDFRINAIRYRKSTVKKKEGTQKRYWITKEREQRKEKKVFRYTKS